MKAIRANVNNTYSFDLGIPGWAEQYPEDTILLGKPLPESSVKFIPKSEFKKKTLSWEDFQKKAHKPGIAVIDTRDSIQKGFLSKAAMDGLSDDAKNQLAEFQKENSEMLNALGRRKVRNASFDMLQNILLKNKRYQSQTLLIFDQVGKQVRWLMYNLELAGIKNYFFLSKGANGVIGIQAYGKK